MLAQPSTHRTLLARLADAHDQTAWRDFHQRYAELIRGFARRRGAQPADCDDVVQEVLMALQKAMPGFTYDPARGTFRSYLKTIALRALDRRFRKNTAAASLELDGDAEPTAPDDEAEQAWETEWRRYHLRLAMRAIEVEFNARERRAFELYGVAGRPVNEVARTTGLSVEHVYAAKSRIVKRLGELVADQVREEG